MTPLDLSMAFIAIALSIGIISGIRLVARREPEDSLIGLNVATICTVTELVILDEFYGLSFGRDIAFSLLFPGVIGIIAYAKFLRGGVFR